MRSRSNVFDRVGERVVRRSTRLSIYIVAGFARLASRRADGSSSERPPLDPLRPFARFPVCRCTLSYFCDSCPPASGRQNVLDTRESGGPRLAPARRPPPAVRLQRRRDVTQIARARRPSCRVHPLHFISCCCRWREPPTGRAALPRMSRVDLSAGFPAPIRGGTNLDKTDAFAVQHKVAVGRNPGLRRGGCCRRWP